MIRGKEWLLYTSRPGIEGEGFSGYVNGTVDFIKPYELVRIFGCLCFML